MLYKTEALTPDKQNNYEIAYQEAANNLSRLEIADISGKSGAAVITANHSKALLLSFLGDEILVTHPEISVTYKGRDNDVPMWVKILTLHYLVRAGGKPPRNEQITFQQIGNAYYPAFQRRSITPLIEKFGSHIEGFLHAGGAAGGTASPLGEFALAFRAFPNVTVIFVLWKGDDEFPSSGSVIFDASITDYLSTEDVAVLCNMIAVRILKAAV